MTDTLAPQNDGLIRKAFSHERTSTGKDEWLTPPEIIEALGAFDLDPCAPVVRPWPTASEHFTINDDGLARPWHGRVWLNPPYGTKAKHWMRRMAAHGNGIALVFARTETSMFFESVWGEADSVLFVKGRLTFRNVDGSKPAFAGGAPSCLIAYGAANTEHLAKCSIAGFLARARQ